MIDAQGGFIMPGLIDSHVHLVFDGINFMQEMNTPYSLNYYKAMEPMRRTLEAGITSVRDAGGADLGMKQAVEQRLNRDEFQRRLQQHLDRQAGSEGISVADSFRADPFGLDELVLSSFRHPGIRLLSRVVSLGRNLDAPRGQRLREAQQLGFRRAIVTHANRSVSSFMPVSSHPSRSPIRRA